MTARHALLSGFCHTHSLQPNADNLLDKDNVLPAPYLLVNNGFKESITLSIGHPKPASLLKPSVPSQQRRGYTTACITDQCVGHIQRLLLLKCAPHWKALRISGHQDFFYMECKNLLWWKLQSPTFAAISLSLAPTEPLSKTHLSACQLSRGKPG